MLVQTIEWKLDEALALARKLEPECRFAGYFVSLAGSVLILGQSSHDLDLLIVARTDRVPNIDRMLAFLNITFTPMADIKFLADRLVLRMALDGRRVDITLIDATIGDLNKLKG